MTDSPITPELDAVVAALAAADRVLIASHENPDGDAIGSMSAAALALRQAGKQVRLYLHADSPLPHEYGFLDMTGLERTIEPGLDRRLDAAGARLRQRVAAGSRPSAAA